MASFGSSLNYVDEVRHKLLPLFLCASVVGSEHSDSPRWHGDIEFLRFKFTDAK
ncbi:MAG: hypothetical protein WBH08_06250 [Methanothrix sp.]|uniref:hypothetical protein n=1 Tax=Methanothrix sp. TaxID=90426 RepID=UPI003BB69899